MMSNTNPCICGGEFKLALTPERFPYFECVMCGASSPKRMTPGLAAQLLFLLQQPTHVQKAVHTYNSLPSEARQEITFEQVVASEKIDELLSDEWVPGDKHIVPEELIPLENDITEMIEIGFTDFEEPVYFDGHQCGCKNYPPNISDFSFGMSGYKIFNTALSKISFEKYGKWPDVPCVGTLHGGIEVKFFNGEIRPLKLRSVDDKAGSRIIFIKSASLLNKLITESMLMEPSNE